MSTDSDIKQLIIITNRSIGKYTFLNPENTKENKNKILEELKFYSDNTDEKSLLKSANILGYNSIEEYVNYAKEVRDISKRINEKFPTLKSLPSHLVQEALTNAMQNLQSELPYVIYPNKNGVSSVYHIDNFKSLQSRRLDCCQGVWNALQNCYNTSDSNFILNSIFCGLASFGCAPLAGPWGVGGCATVCIASAAVHYGNQLDGCTTTAQNSGSACADGPCF